MNTVLLSLKRTLVKGTHLTYLKVWATARWVKLNEEKHRTRKVCKFLTSREKKKIVVPHDGKLGICIHRECKPRGMTDTNRQKVLLTSEA